MTDRQITSYLSRIQDDDENKDLFVRVIVPALRKVGSGGENNFAYCPLCSTEDLLRKSDSTSKPDCVKTVVKFTSYYAFVRHLSTKHRELLPCNGYVLSDSEPAKFSCSPCGQHFARRDHYNSHLKSIKHQNKMAGAKQFKDQKETRQKSIFALRNCSVVLSKIDAPSVEYAFPREEASACIQKDGSSMNEDVMTFDHALRYLDDFNSPEEEDEEPDLDYHLTMSSGEDIVEPEELYDSTPGTYRDQSNVATSSVDIETLDALDQEPEEPRANTESAYSEEDEDQLLLEALLKFELGRSHGIDAPRPATSTSKRSHSEDSEETEWDDGPESKKQRR